MKKIIIFGIYALEDGYKALSLELSKYYEIAFFPLFVYRDRLEDSNMYDESTIYKALKGEKITMQNYINSDNKCDAVIFWYNFDFLCNFEIKKINFNMIDFIEKIKNDYKLININWDPEYGFNKFNVNNLFDLSFNVSPFLEKYINNFTFFNQGFNELMTFKTNKYNNYKCDVSCVITNLYENYGDNIDYSRKKILDILINSNLTVHVYGPIFLETLYPNNYKGFVSYNNLKYVFSNSLFSLNISPLNNIEYNNNYYYSERMALIFASECIMITNNDFNNFLPKESYIRVEKTEELINTLNEIKNNIALYEKYISHVKIIKNKFNYDYIVKNTFVHKINNILN